MVLPIKQNCRYGCALHEMPEEVLCWNFIIITLPWAKCTTSISLEMYFVGWKFKSTLGKSNHLNGFFPNQFCGWENLIFEELYCRRNWRNIYYQQFFSSTLSQLRTKTNHHIGERKWCLKLNFYSGLSSYIIVCSQKLNKLTAISFGDFSLQ